MLDAALAPTGGDSGVMLALTVTNGGDDPVTLRFRTGQRADFAAFEPAAGDGADDPRRSTVGPVWRHAEGRLFTGALGTETLAPGESATYEATWPDPPAGEYLVVGTLTAEEGDAEATATVAID
ncbi:BsuPI-related putative proteinase inhibitor [Halorubrum yunnanense]|uniref:Intracellular proteinase inhibitor BsuPI domain-containing protein n=1 Tax=Halorubrum yunnanense TaxID=1526162 RepID=A0ABD5YCA2_9EURY|nr:BsuPI-related putative proteinase inhibitor [Halorubrum yunnanense]